MGFACLFYNFDTDSVCRECSKSVKIDTVMDYITFNFDEFKKLFLVVLSKTYSQWLKSNLEINSTIYKFCFTRIKKSHISKY